MDGKWPAPPADWTNAVKAKREENIAKMAPRLMKNTAPMDFHGALGALRTVIKERPDAILVNEGANTLDLARGVIDMYKPRKRLDVGTWGVMGIGMGFAIARRDRDRQARARGRRRQRLRLLRHGGGDDLPLRPAGLRRHLQQQRHLSRHRRQFRGRPGPCDDRLRQRLALRQDDGSLRRRRRPCDDPRRAQARRQRGHGLRQADPHQRGDRSGGRQRERPHRQSQPAKRGEEEDRGAMRNEGTRRRPHPRHEPRAGGADLHAASRLVRRRRHQGGAAGRGRHHARAAAGRPQGGQPLLHHAEPQQALDHARHQAPQGQGGAGAPDQDLRRAGRELRRPACSTAWATPGSASRSSTRA